MPLHLSRVAYACDSLSVLIARLDANGVDGEVRLTTRNGPRRAAELPGGSLYWIIAHQLVARSPIIGTVLRDDGYTDIRIRPEVIPVRPRAKRAHQGWRYLNPADAPDDLGSGAGADLPDDLERALAGLGLI